MNISQITAHLQGVITLPSVRLALVTVTTYLWLVPEEVKIRCNLDFSLLSMNRKNSLVPFQDMEFAQNYTNPPIVLLAAKHSTSGQDSAASECNGIESWEEVGLWPFHKDWRISTADFLITLRLFSLFWFYFFFCSLLPTQVLERVSRNFSFNALILLPYRTQCCQVMEFWQIL